MAKTSVQLHTSYLDKGNIQENNGLPLGLRILVFFFLIGWINAVFADYVLIGFSTLIFGYQGHFYNDFSCKIYLCLDFTYASTYR